MSCLEAPAISAASSTKSRLLGNNLSPGGVLMLSVLSRPELRQRACRIRKTAGYAPPVDVDRSVGAGCYEIGVSIAVDVHNGCELGVTLRIEERRRELSAKRGDRWVEVAGG